MAKKAARKSPTNASAGIDADAASDVRPTDAPETPAAPTAAAVKQRGSASTKASSVAGSSHDDRIEQRTLEIGTDLFARSAPRSLTVFHAQWWEDRLMHWAMNDPAVKVQLFRFVDVLPMLRDHAAISRHLDEYFEDVRSHLPWAVRLGLDLSTGNSILSRALAFNARTNAARMARRFIAGSNAQEVLQTVQQLRRNRLAFTLDLLGESVISDAEADRYQRTLLQLLNDLADPVNAWPDDELLDQTHSGHMPRLNLSLKLSALDSQFSNVDTEGTYRRVASRLRPILHAARQHGAQIHIDMEQHDHKSLTFHIFQRILMEDEFRDFADCGIVVQAYLRSAETDLNNLLDWSRRRETPVTVRLVKGAYWDYENIVAQARGWPIPVYRRKWQSDDCYERLSRTLLENHELLRPAFASHNLRSLAHATALAEVLQVPDNAWEIQMLYGMSDEQAVLFRNRGRRVRIYTPFGELIPGMAYLVRRLLENTSNESFLRQNFSEHVPAKTLLMKPSKLAATEPPLEDPQPQGFQNEPCTDFSDSVAREAMQDAIQSVRENLGKSCPLVIDGKFCETRTTIISRNPSRHSEIIGKVASASLDQTNDAVDAARRAFQTWCRSDVATRLEYIDLIAAEIRERRFELAAWIILETGKPWAEADAEVSEAIDFCVYYSQEFEKLGQPRKTPVPGEDNSYFYRPRGVCAVIAPWNFPLAILTGMTIAAVITGNTVVMKPAEQSSVVAARFMDIIRNSGLPAGVVNFLPGIGEEIGPALVTHPEVDLIAFTGSQAVGLEINRVAADTGKHQQNVRRVIAEMGGKNAIIIDDDADLDEAVLGVVRSAFGYSGQKCSACSRVIVLDSIYEQFTQRLVDAVRSLPIGPAEDPSTRIGPVIDEEARERLQNFIRKLDPEQGPQLLLAVDPGPLAKKGSFIGPHLFTAVDPESALAQQELFGPILSIIRVRTLDDAFNVANNTRYALTGGVYSRSPVTLRRARNEFHVGNLYLNREITGALVQRHPFGGFRMSGIGSKAGGPDYLLQFLIPIAISENTMRRGFAPET
jgi:RHH-type proline utilization regulon transcriptional repressor/proline dehydrogenase/delta 1-pyrroline-5-carboxylate dehydrogenase